MSREKQIEEMANAMCNLGESNCQECANHWDFVTVPQCDLVKRAERLYNAGYRKQSEVAREIFDSIGKILYKYDKVAERDKSEYGELIVGDIGFAIAELKKKYTEEQT